jgi:hypothetical protein
VTVLDGAAGGLHAARALLLLTPEWNCAATREATAAALARCGDAAAAAVLRAKASSRLSKAQLLALCAHWGYAHHAWRRRGDGPPRTKRPRSAGGEAPPAADGAAAAASSGAGATWSPGDAAGLQLLPSPALAVPRHVDSVLLVAFDAGSLAAFLAGPMHGAAAACHGALEGRRARPLAEAARLPLCAAHSERHYAAIAAACRLLCARLEGLAAAQHVWGVAARARCDTDPRLAAAATWQVLPALQAADGCAGVLPAEASADALRAGFAAASRVHAAVAAIPLQDTADVAINVARAELLDGIHEGLRFAAAADAALAAARACGACGVVQYAALSQACAAESARLVAGAHDALMERVAWTSRVLQPGFYKAAPPLMPQQPYGRVLASFLGELAAAAAKPQQTPPDGATELIAALLTA